MSKEVKKFWDDNSRQYQKDSNIQIGIHYGPGSPYEDSLKLIGNVRGKKVLELGCGGAQCSIEFAKKGASVTAVDLSDAQLKFAKKLAGKHKVNIDFHQGSFQSVPFVKSKSQDIVFSAFAFQYSPDLNKCFKKVNRVLKKKGLFVFSLDHPMYRIADYKTLRLVQSYFKTGKKIEKWGNEDFVIYDHTFSELYNPLAKSGFFVEQIIEPDSRKKYKNDPWYGLWMYKPKLLKMMPPTIIFKCRKI